jgi:hypothetical protein
MERLFCFLVFLGLFQIHCNVSQVIAPPLSGRITIRIELVGPGPIDPIDIEVLSTGIRIIPDPNGLATIDLKPGHYVVRLRGLNGPGPSSLYRDFPVDLHAGEEIVITAVDCPACV